MAKKDDNRPEMIPAENMETRRLFMSITRKHLIKGCLFKSADILFWDEPDLRQIGVGLKPHQAGKGRLFPVSLNKIQSVMPRL
jgi:hypothetical protein